MVIDVSLINCHIIGFISLHAFIDYIRSDMYLIDAEVTPELQEHVLSFNPEKIRNFIPHNDLPAYLSCVQALVRLLSSVNIVVLDLLTAIQDFGSGSGSGGTIYQQQLNIIVRYFLKKRPNQLDGLGKCHKISEILRQIENESTQIRADMEQEETQPEPAVVADKKLEESLAAKKKCQESPAPNEEQQETKKHSSLAHTVLRSMWKSKNQYTAAQEARNQREDGASSSRPKLGLSWLFRK